MTLRRSLFLRLVFVLSCSGICILTGYLIWTPSLGEDGALMAGVFMAAAWYGGTSIVAGT